MQIIILPSVGKIVYACSGLFNKFQNLVCSVLFVRFVGHFLGALQVPFPGKACLNPKGLSHFQRQ